MHAPLWFLPSFYGDVRLERMGTSTEIIVEKATVQEHRALALLTEYAVKKKWISEGAEIREGRAKLKAPIEKVATRLAKFMKPGRKLVTAVRFADGAMEEVTEAPIAGGAGAKTLAPYREEPKPTVIEKPLEKVPEKAVTVAAPERGCPAPDFVRAELKARVVLEHFLTPEQMEDFRRYNRFVTVGGTTGHRYMVTSRHNRAALEKFTRTLFDLDEGVAYCVHDWTVPAAEEMLAIHLFLQMPGRESYLRFLD